ncbi:nitrogen fixation protein NifQ [Agarivorans sp. MS3-6]
MSSTNANANAYPPFISQRWLGALSNIFQPISVENRRWFRQMSIAQLTGSSSLPHGLGLDNASYLELKRVINNNEVEQQELLWLEPSHQLIRKRAAVFAEVSDLRAQERNELIALLMQYANDEEPYAVQMAVIIASASLSQIHLWRSLGLSNRAELSELIRHNFPKLHAMNTKNMRWKRFFYRQLCEQGGDYICRAPSCVECSSYAECFV